MNRQMVVLISNVIEAQFDKTITIQDSQGLKQWLLAEEIAWNAGEMFKGSDKLETISKNKRKKERELCVLCDPKSSLLT